MIEETVRAILNDHGRLSTDALALSPTADLYSAGLTSHASVTLMLALEDAFDIEFPEQLLTRSTFGSIASIEETIAELQGGPLGDPSLTVPDLSRQER